MKKMMTLVALICAVAFQVNAQTQEPESKIDKMLRLTRAADNNPTDWQAQLEAGHFLLDKENGMYNQSQAEKYFERIYHLATDRNTAVPDSVLHEAGITLVTVAVDRKNLDMALFYIDELRHAQRVGADMGEGSDYTLDTMGLLYSMLKGDMVRTMTYMMEFREKLAKGNIPGIEYTELTTAVLFEALMSTYRDMFSDKLIELTLDGKKYIILSLGSWNIEKPLMGWTLDNEESTMLLYGEDDKVYDDLHGKMEYGFTFDKEGVKPKEESNARLISVTPERRQVLIEAYRNYNK